MNEGKRGFKNKKDVISPSKPRNFVAKNASTGGAGAHKDKKKAEKQGDTKHKKTPADMLEGTSYERSLELQLKIAVVENTIMERDPAAYAKAARSSINKNIGAGMMRDPSDPVRVKADRNIANRERGLQRQRDRYMAKKPERDALAQQQVQQAIEADKDNLPALTRELEQMKKRFNPNYEYADNHTVWSVNQSLEKQILALQNRIARAQGGQEEGYHVYSEFDGGKDEPYKYQYTGHTFGDRNSANLKAQELDDDLEYGGSQSFHRHIVKDRHPHVREGKINELSKASLSNYSDKADMDIVKKHRVRGPQAAAGDKEAVAKTDKKIDKRMAGIDKAAGRINKESVDILKQMIAEGTMMDFLPPFTATGFYVDDRRRNTVLQANDQTLAKELAKLLNKAFPPRQATGISKLEGVAEEHDAEYDDEAGMADNNIETMKRAVAGLDDLISKGDNLPEWCQEKIAVSKSMLVAVWDYMASEEQGVAEGEIERQHGDTKPWAYWGYPERVAKKLYQIYKGQPVGKAEVVKLWKEDGPDRMTKFMLKPDLSAILSAYEQMSDSGPLFKEGSTPTDKKAPTEVRDRKTGKMYNPAKEFDKTMNSPEVKAQMKRMAKK